MLEPENEPTGFPVTDWKDKRTGERVKVKPKPEKATRKHIAWRNAPAFVVFLIVICLFVLMGIVYASEVASEKFFTVRNDTVIPVNLK